MGTNYYLVVNKCECCNRRDLVHIGKKSLGWQFSFYGPVQQFPDLRSWESWKVFLINQLIVDEYDRDITFEEFVLLVENSKDGRNHFDACTESFPDWIDRVGQGIDWKDEEGWSFSSGEFS